MKNDKFHIYLSDAERTQVIQTLIELKNSLLEQGKYTDAVDDVLLKFTKAKRKHLQVHYICCRVSANFKRSRIPCPIISHTKKEWR